MKNTNLTAVFMAAVAIPFVTVGMAHGQRVLLLVDRATGELSAVSSADVEVDGYSITSPAGRLNPETWTSLTEQGSEGWSEANPRNQQLSELNWEGAGTLTGLQPVSLGNAYDGVGVSPSQEDIEFQYSTPDGTLGTGSVQYLGPSQAPGITVDRQSGLIEVSNPLGFELTGYSILSPGGGLKAEEFNSLASQNVEGWTEANPSNTALAELNLEQSLVVDAQSPFTIGNAYTPGTPEDLTFEYLTLEGEFAEGLVNYTGPVNDLVLEVDLLTGAAKIQNNSSFADPFDIFGYSITSESGSLSVETWNSFEDSGAAGDGWMKANPTSHAIAELNPTSTTLFDAGTSMPIGNILGDVQDLVFEYGTTDGPALGTVQYVLNLGAPTPGDCTGDGILDAADLACVGTIAERDAVLTALNTLPGDLDGDGQVAFPDFLVLSANFGTDLPSYSAGNIDLIGDVAFPDFLVLSANFGKTPAGAAAAVPEPASGLLAAIGMLFLLAIRKGR